MNRKTTCAAERDFPEIVQVGSACVKIYFTPKNGRDAFTVSYTLLGDRHRDYFSEYVDAKAAAKDAAARINRGDQDVLALRSQDRLIYLRALEALAGIEKPLDIVALEFAEAFKISKGTSMVELAKFYLQHRSEKTFTPKFSGDITAELLQAKTLQGRSAYHIKDLRCRLKQFSNAFSCPLANVSSPQIESFLKTLKVTPRSRNNMRRVIGILFTFAKRQGYVSRTHPGISEVDRFTEEPSEITTFSPVQLQSFLVASPENMVAYLAIAAFGGLRQEELKRLHWEDIKWDENWIEVKAKNAKMRDRRIVPLLPNLKAWLLQYRDLKGPVLLLKNVSEPIRRLVKKVGIEWSRDVLRHSYISYRIAVVRDVGDVALEAGNSPQVIKSNYLFHKTKAEAESWFGVMPSIREAESQQLAQAA